MHRNRANVHNILCTLRSVYLFIHIVEKKNVNKFEFNYYTSKTKGGSQPMHINN